MRKICKQCGKEFEAKNSRKIFCSSYCTHKNCVEKNDPESGEYICETCGKSFTYTKHESPRSSSNTGRGLCFPSWKFCSYECGCIARRQKTEKTCMKKYNTRNGGGTLTSIEKGKKTKATNAKNNPNYKLEIQEKAKQTSLLHFGVEHPLQSAEIQNKIKQTYLKRYGTENIQNLDSIKEKKKLTCLKHFGVENPIQSSTVKEKVKSTNLKRYGTKTPCENKKIAEKITKAWKAKSKDEIEDFVKKVKETKRKKYGNEIYNGREKIDWEETFRKGFETKIKNGTFMESKAEKELASFINSLGYRTTKLRIGNSHEKERFEIDIYIPELKIGIEYNGIYFHSTEFKNPAYHQDKLKTAINEDIYLTQIWEDEWKNNSEEVKLRIKNILENKQDIKKEKTITIDPNTTNYNLLLNEGYKIKTFTTPQRFYVHNSKNLEREHKKPKSKTYYECYDCGNIILEKEE